MTRRPLPWHRRYNWFLVSRTLKSVLYWITVSALALSLCYVSAQRLDEAQAAQENQKGIDHAKRF